MSVCDGLCASWQVGSVTALPISQLLSVDGGPRSEAFFECCSSRGCLGALEREQASDP